MSECDTREQRSNLQIVPGYRFAHPGYWEGTMAKVAFVGLGVMGYPRAGHLKAKGGHEVTVFNRTTAKAEKWVGQYGGKSSATPKQAAEGQDLVMTCVGNDNDLREVM